uniref:Uncharacterized protein n=1 Tax=Rhizophagus irregularis (strain DAOM 181602 / DAOM 197198 / MUCL 43194) TaxID=747089 RepID=U9TF40_RHIID
MVIDTLKKRSTTRIAIFQDQVDIYKEDLDNDSAKDYQCKDSLKEKSEKFFGGVYRGSKKMKNNGNN